MIGAEAIVKTLEDLGTDIAFGIPGGAVLPLYDALYNSQKLRHVLARHEQGAGHAAEGYAQATGKVGVMVATSGPGFRPWCGYHRTGGVENAGYGCFPGS